MIKFQKQILYYSNKSKIQFESNHNTVTGFDWINKQKLKNFKYRFAQNFSII